MSSKCNTHGAFFCVVTHEVSQIIKAVMKYVLDVMVVLTWLGMSLAVVSLVGHYRKTHASVGAPDNRDEYRADRDMAVKLVVFVISVLSVVVMYALNRLVG